MAGQRRNRYDVDTSIRIDGLAQFTRALRQVDRALPAAVTELNFKAAKSLRDAARAEANMQGGVARKAARSGLRASKSQRSAAVILGGRRAPYAFGAEFGSKRYRRFRPWRGNSRVTTWLGGPGYFLHPAIRKEGPRIVNEYMNGINDLTRQAFPDL